MVITLLDDHLLRDWLVGPDSRLRRSLGESEVATTNLFYARLCKSAARYRGGALLGSWNDVERDVVISGLISLPDAITVVPMVDVAWRIGQLVNEFSGLSTLGAEAVASAERLGARVLVSSLDDSPGVRHACRMLGIKYTALRRG